MHKKNNFESKGIYKLEKMKMYLVIFKNHSIIAYFDPWLKTRPRSYNLHIIDAVAKSNTRLSSSLFYQ